MSSSLFAGLVGAEPDLTIDSGFGSAREAAEQVEYCNGSVNTRMGKMRAENGHPEPFNVRYWTIGNEMYGPWQYGHMSLDQYWVKHNRIVEAMKAVDPNIKVTVSGASICEKSVDAAEKKGQLLPQHLGAADYGTTAVRVRFNLRLGWMAAQKMRGQYRQSLRTHLRISQSGLR